MITFFAAKFMCIAFCKYYDCSASLTIKPIKFPSYHKYLLFRLSRVVAFCCEILLAERLPLSIDIGSHDFAYGT